MLFYLTRGGGSVWANHNGGPTARDQVRFQEAVYNMHHEKCSTCGHWPESGVGRCVDINGGNDDEPACMMWVKRTD